MNKQRRFYVLLLLTVLLVLLTACGTSGGMPKITFFTMDDGDYETPFSFGEGMSYLTMRFEANVQPWGNPIPMKYGNSETYHYVRLAFENMMKDVTDSDFQFAKTVTAGLGAVQIGDKWGYVELMRDDSKPGYRVVIEPQYESAEPFSGGLAAVKQNGLYGYINGNGQWLIAPSYKSAHFFSGGTAAVEGDEGWFFINEQGKIAIPGPFEGAESFASETDDALAVVKKDGLWGYIDRTGAWVITPTFEKAWSFEGSGIVKYNGKWKTIDRTGKVSGNVKNPIEW